MLHDRDYMRNSPRYSGPSLTVTLIILLIILYVVQLSLTYQARLPLDDWFALSLDGIKHKHLWQLLTFQFMHSTPWPWHVLFNCLGLYFFGRPMEETLGRKKFLALYLGSGIVGGVVQLLATLALRHADGPVVGASAGVMGVFAAYATLYPMRELTVFLYFFPLTLRAQYLFWLALFLAVVGTIIPSGGVANAAHLGGLLMGMAFIHWDISSQQQPGRWRPFQSRQRKLELVKAASKRTDRVTRPKKTVQADLPPSEFISKEVDPILDKISAHGIQSLTERERQILQAARTKMSKK